MWVLDVDRGVWSEVTLPQEMGPQLQHTATVFGSGPNFRMVVMFGGMREFLGGNPIAETTLLHLECCGGGWQGTGMVTKSELGRPVGRLREQMEKLQLHSSHRSEGKAGMLEQQLVMAEERVRRLEGEKQATETRAKIAERRTLPKNGKMVSNTPFSIVENKRLDCQFGHHYYKEKLQKSSRVRIQGSRKMGCLAHITIKKCTLYPDYSLQPDEGGNSTIRTLKEKKMAALKANLCKNAQNVTTKTMYYVSLPTEDSHQGHPTGAGTAGFAQRVNDKVAIKISELVADGVTESDKVRSIRWHYVLKDLCKNNPPDCNDRAYFPMDTDLRNHIYMAKWAMQLSCLDQENIKLKLENWKVIDPESNHFFRPYLLKEKENCKPPQHQQQSGTPSGQTGETSGRFTGNDGIHCNLPTDSSQYEQTLLWVHQTEWRRQLLSRYGNTISLIDATYKATQYDLALFFICVRTNVGYSVVAEFILQSETAESILEALEILKAWNPTWNPPYFMSDYSEAELAALEIAFPGVRVYLCDFHREQSWTRWVKDHKHGLSHSEAESLLTLLRACAWAPPGDGDVASIYKLAVNDLKESEVWKSHIGVRQWLSTMWLNIPERWARAFRDNCYHAAIDTNNGTEAQNKLFKYSFLPRKKQKATLSSTISIIVENYLPSVKNKYLLQNYQQSSLYRSYKSFIPSYLHDCPRSVILHCLDRRTNSAKFSAESVHDVDKENGIFEVEKTSGGRHTVNFGILNADSMPSCTCKNWVRHHLPCKHFFSVFMHRKDWPWEKLPHVYLNSAYLSTDTQALCRHFSIPTQNSSDMDSGDTESPTETPETSHMTDQLPKKVHSTLSMMAGVKARISLKSLETLTYSCIDAEMLLEVEERLQSLLKDLKAQLPQEEGLVIRPAIVSRAIKTKRKYAHIRARQQSGYCSALTEGKKCGRKRANSKFRNRVGCKADRLRKEAYREEARLDHN